MVVNEGMSYYEVNEKIVMKNEKIVIMVNEEISYFGVVNEKNELL